MAIFKRRLLFWLIRAYIKRWGKRILFFFILGLVVFFILLKTAAVLVPRIPVGSKESIGLVGAYRLDNLPPSILYDISRGLTSLAQDGSVRPDLASSWEIKNGGKTYVFYLKKGIRYNDGTPLTSETVTYNFSDVTIKHPDKYTVEFSLKESFAPFLVTVSRPLLKKNFVGVGDYKIKDIKLNGDFIESLTLSSIKNQYNIKVFHFYPTEDALKLAFSLGEVSRATGLSDVSFQNTTFTNFPNTTVSKIINYNRLVALFFNTQDAELSNEKMRGGLSYALPDSFEQGERAYSPFSPYLWAYVETQQEKHEDLSHAQLLLNAQDSSTSASFVIKTLPKYKKIAEQISASWNKVNVLTTIEEVDTVPAQFQIFLGDFMVPKDPDQYTLWHKDQGNNITRYANLRIDKLLEDARKTTDTSERQKMYADFQKYLLADSPAAFLYFPYEYEIERK